MAALGSKWDGLNRHLLASMWEVDNKGVKAGGDSVFCPLTQAEMEVSLQWQSPFEQSGAESKAPALMAMLQSGALQPVMASLGLDGGDGKAKAGDQSVSGKLGGMLEQVKGRTGITKLNSTQVFVGMAPVKIQITALFRAWENPRAEVESPVDKLMEWALPKSLLPDGMVVNAINAIKGSGSWIDVLMPSQAPIMIAMQYKGRVYSPLVIESISNPMDSPIDKNGRHTQLLIPMTLASLTAWDRADWSNTRKVSL